MNILYIIGNGFDKAQGMATSYPEFYQYLMKNTIESSLELFKMKQKIKDNIELWSDMEIALGKYTENFSESNEYIDLHIELTKLLHKYLTEEEDKYNPSEKQKVTFKSNILTPQNYLLPFDKNQFNTITSSLRATRVQVSFISLNYTNTLFKLLSIKNEMKSYMDINTDNCGSILYLHGYLESDGIIIGVSEAEQIINKKFKTDPDIGDILIKEKSNAAIGNLSTIQCENMVKNADIIVIYGSSLGDTDNYLWKFIERYFKAKGNLCIIQHIHDENFAKAIPQQRKKFDRKYQNILLNKINFLNATEQQKSRLFFVYNKNLTEPIK